METAEKTEVRGPVAQLVASRVPTAQAPALPLGRRSPRGQVRWYLLACPKGREAATCQKLRQLLPADVLQDAFVPRVERIKKYQGRWTTITKSLFEGYVVVASADAPALAKALSKLSLPARLAGGMDGSYAPIDADAQAFLGRCMDETHTIRQSEGELVADQLHVLWGPLKGQEARVSGVNRKKSFAWVRVGESAEKGGAFTLMMPLAIPERR